jgi:hypothetical protein
MFFHLGEEFFLCLELFSHLKIVSFSCRNLFDVVGRCMNKLRLEVTRLDLHCTAARSTHAPARPPARPQYPEDLDTPEINYGLSVFSWFFLMQATKLFSDT